MNESSCLNVNVKTVVLPESAFKEMFYSKRK